MYLLSDRISRISGASSRGQHAFEIKLGHAPLIPSSKKNINNTQFFDSRSTEEYSSYQLLRILALLKQEGYLRFYTIHTVGRCVWATVFLKYTAQGTPAIRSIFTISTSGRPVYISATSLWQPLSTTGTFIMSTPRGLLTDKEARRLSVGGLLVLGIVLCF